LELCACSGPPTWVDPMLEELDASLVASPSAGAPASGCLTASAVGSYEADALLVDIHSPVKIT
jgi:hypothetical protein